ncbi:rRNA maturation RNase YbeY [Spiroplasma endosymbiont of Amphibalanus improvisus]|uniref:rRNA maturation RNase YbeY n=1 Tax=Spiroplasma endosymbiont of Amphibalanus improvisus TaxID=3066327 RepID=UPI00313F3372
MEDTFSIINHTQNFINNFEDNWNKILLETKKTLKIKKRLELSLNIVDPKMQVSLNVKYRNKDYIADVLSFEMKDNILQLVDKNTMYLGDIFICFEQAEKQAKEYGHSLERELAFLFLHGLLHILGYDHINEADEKIMFGYQDQILKNLSINR